MEDAVPAFVPALQEFSSRRRRLDKLGVAVAIRFLPVAGQEICPARAHVPGHVFDDDGNRVHLFVERREQLFVRDLFHRALGHFFVETK